MSVFCDALASLKRAAVYTVGDIRTLLSCCRENRLINGISSEGDPIEAWSVAVKRFFLNPKDVQMAIEFIEGYGKGDLHSLISYIEYYENTARKILCEAETALQSKEKLYTVLGLFSGTVIVLLLI